MRKKPVQGTAGLSMDLRLCAKNSTKSKGKVSSNRVR